MNKINITEALRKKKEINCKNLKDSIYLIQFCWENFKLPLAGLPPTIKAIKELWGINKEKICFSLSGTCIMHTNLDTIAKENKEKIINFEDVDFVLPIFTKNKYKTYDGLVVETLEEVEKIWNLILKRGEAYGKIYKYSSGFLITAEDVDTMELKHIPFIKGYVRIREFYKMFYNKTYYCAYTKAGMELLSDIGIVLNIDCIEQNIFAYHNKISKIKLIYDDKIENKDEYFWKNHLKEQISFCNL